MNNDRCHMVKQWQEEGSAEIDPSFKNLFIVQRFSYFSKLLGWRQMKDRGNNVHPERF